MRYVRGRRIHAEPLSTIITPCGDAEAAQICEIINAAARAYKGVIPPECWHDPYMPLDELRSEIDRGVSFIGFRVEGRLAGVMGSQDVLDVTLIRHAYVEPGDQGKGVGHALLDHLVRGTSRPILVGTWTAATWAIRFYERHGFRLTSPAQARSLLERYWVVPEPQMEVSSVLEHTSYLKV